MQALKPPLSSWHSNVAVASADWKPKVADCWLVGLWRHAVYGHVRPRQVDGPGEGRGSRVGVAGGVGGRDREGVAAGGETTVGRRDWCRGRERRRPGCTGRRSRLPWNGR